DTRFSRDWGSDVCSSDLADGAGARQLVAARSVGAAWCRADAAAQSRRFLTGEADHVSRHPVRSEGRSVQRVQLERLFLGADDVVHADRHGGDVGRYLHVPGQHPPGTAAAGCGCDQLVSSWSLVTGAGPWGPAV